MHSDLNSDADADFKAKAKVFAKKKTMVKPMSHRFHIVCVMLVLRYVANRYILNTTFSGELCVWCYGSAALSFSLLVLVTLVGGLARLA